MQSPATTARLKALDPIVIKCGPVTGRVRNINPPAPRHLGTFEGERKRECAGYDESYGATKAALSLIALTGFMLAAAIFLGAI
ncbi:MAG: hypothetical protein WBA36_03665 [Mesorhizobium sp.]